MPPVIRRATSRVWLPWQPGPEAGADGPIVVRLTDFRMDSLRSLPGIVRAGTHLGLGWYGLPGAIGLRLWVDPLHRRVGSLSLWTERAALRRWVGLPLHVSIMRRYRTRGSVRSALWESAGPDRDTILAVAARRLDTGDYG